jgi:hypothetical protein
MKDPVVRIVLFPRPTSIWGTTAVTSEAFNAKDFAKAIVVAGRGTGMGSTPATVTVIMEKSADMVRWFDAGEVQPWSGGEATLTVDLDLEWIRAKATVSGTVPGITLWAVADLVPRVSSAS